MSSKSLANIVRVAQRGNHAAFDLLVRRYAAPAIAYARVLLTGWSNSDVAEDVAQEAFVQAWRDLPQLREPEAFPAWLRRVVFKHCDRVRRATHGAGELPTTLATPRDTEPAQYVERNAENEVLHNALRRLPEAYRDVTLLYYFNDLDVATTGQTLGIPASTVKNRLFAARKRLRKELSTMNETSAVSNNSETNKSTTAFAESVLAKILGDYRAQNAADPLNANRTLLDTGVAELRRVLDSGTAITDELCRDALTLLWQRWDFQTLAAFLSRYLVEPNLSASHRAWAYLHLANALALTGSAAGAVLAHEAWEREGSDDVSLLEWFPYYPAPQDTAEATYRGDEVALLFLSQSVEFAETYAAVWRGADYGRKVSSLLKSVPVRDDADRLRRFLTLRIVCAVQEKTNRGLEAAETIAQMLLLADSATDPDKQKELRVKALSSVMDRARTTGDDAGFAAALAQSSAILAASGNAAWVHGERHDLAHQLTMAGKYADALPLWEQNRATTPQGHANGWGWLLHAATRWKVTGDRAATLDLLRHARATEQRDLRDLFLGRPEFAPIRDDAEFLAAVSPVTPVL